MPREAIVVQVGQCGNQIGCRFWDLALHEHARRAHGRLFDESMASLFCNINEKASRTPFAQKTGGSAPTESDFALEVGAQISSLKARTVLVDMEEGVINSIRSSYLKELFDAGGQQFVTAPSGCGNNWAHGFHESGPKYHDRIMDRIRCQAEKCAHLQSFFLLHSLGGGTGSGVGTYLARELKDVFPTVKLFSAAVFPSAQDDVVTSPYNSLLAADQLRQHADVVLPMENSALMGICSRHVTKNMAPRRIRDAKEGVYDRMNNVAAQVLLDVTSSMRFDGALNMDLNEVATNLVPFPDMQFLTASLAPPPVHANPETVRGKAADHKSNCDSPSAMATQVVHKNYQLMQVDPITEEYLACAMVWRGASIGMARAQQSVLKVQPRMRMVHWNKELFKVALCGAPPLHSPRSLLCLANNRVLRHTFAAMRARFCKLYRVRAHLHHYTKYVEEGDVAEALEGFDRMVSAYAGARTCGDMNGVSSAHMLKPLF